MKPVLHLHTGKLCSVKVGFYFQSKTWHADSPWTGFPSGLYYTTEEGLSGYQEMCILSFQKWA